MQGWDHDFDECSGLLALRLLSAGSGYDDFSMMDENYKGHAYRQWNPGRYIPLSLRMDIAGF